MSVSDSPPAACHSVAIRPPIRSELSSEPKLDDLSRVRVLHIFRDRGGHEELIDPPFDFSSTPAPVGALG
jgi:hypothetical protein